AGHALRGGAGTEPLLRGPRGRDSSPFRPTDSSAQSDVPHRRVRVPAHDRRHGARQGPRAVAVGSVARGHPGGPSRARHARGPASRGPVRPLQRPAAFLFSGTLRRPHHPEEVAGPEQPDLARSV
ncbi:MAG: hypothetical protein AVDCRST_MAG04-2533, partial [uncultured Acetobacteraceae bacterium]